jgi:ABC-type iron transport system FetAB permease component
MRSVNDFSLVTVKNIVSFTLVFDSIGTIITGFVTGYISKVNKIKNTLVLTGVIAILDGGFRIYKNAITYTSLVFLFLNLAFCFVGGYIAYLITKNKENPQIAEN